MMRKANPLNDYEITALHLLVNVLDKSLDNEIARRLLATVERLQKIVRDFSAKKAATK